MVYSFLMKFICWLTRVEDQVRLHVQDGCKFKCCPSTLIPLIVIESVISRLHRLVESRQKQLRIVGLSATLPNYQDVAEFLHVPEKGLFYFGPEYRPVPLQQTFVGVMGNVKNRKLIEDKMNDVCYEEVKDALARVRKAQDCSHF